MFFIFAVTERFILFSVSVNIIHFINDDPIRKSVREHWKILISLISDRLVREFSHFFTVN